MPAAFSFKGLRARASKEASKASRTTGVWVGYFHYLHTGKPLPTCRVLRKARKEAFSFYCCVKHSFFILLGVKLCETHSLTAAIRLAVHQFYWWTHQIFWRSCVHRPGNGQVQTHDIICQIGKKLTFTARPWKESLPSSDKQLEIVLRNGSR